MPVEISTVDGDDGEMRVPGGELAWLEGMRRLKDI